jgi:hypothetical protein
MASPETCTESTTVLAWVVARWNVHTVQLVRCTPTNVIWSYVFEVSTPVAKLSEHVPELLVLKRLPLGINKKCTVCTLWLVRIDPDILVVVESLCF